jgi:hypothetical protein
VLIGRTARSGKHAPSVRSRLRVALRKRSRNDKGTRRTLVLDYPKIPLVRKRHRKTLILAIRYFYRFLPILTEFSVREQRLAELAEVADLRRARGAYAHRGRHRCCAEHVDPGRPKHPRCFGQAAARCD